MDKGRLIHFLLTKAIELKEQSDELNIKVKAASSNGSPMSELLVLLTERAQLIGQIKMIKEVLEEIYDKPEPNTERDLRD